MAEPVSQTELKETFFYDPIVGVFIRIKKAKSGQLGDIQNNRTVCGYVRLNLNGKTIKGHRAAFLYMNGNEPERDVDHINRVRWDNSFKNLRDADETQNGQNRKVSKNNKSGIKGVSYDKQRGKWCAHICLNGKQRMIGRYETPELAGEAYDKMALEVFGEFSYNFNGVK